MIKCLACGHGNRAGDKFCAQCASSLTLRLCSLCEAINANTDERCHSCGAALSAEPQAAALLSESAQFIPVRAQDKSLPEHRLSDRAPRRSGLPARAAFAVFLVLSIALLAATAAFYFYPSPLLTIAGAIWTATSAAPEIPARVAATESPSDSTHEDATTTDESNLNAEQSDRAADEAKGEPSPGTPLPAEPAAPHVASPVTPLPAEPAVPDVASPVTHTGARAPTAAVMPPEASTKELPAPIAPPPSYSRVTHTKAPELAPGFAAMPGGVAEKSMKARKEESTDCASGVAALGLCISR